MARDGNARNSTPEQEVTALELETGDDKVSTPVPVEVEVEGDASAEVESPESQGPFFASVYPRDGAALPESLVTHVRAIEEDLKMPVWLLLQSGGPLSGPSNLGVTLYREHLRTLASLPEAPVAVLIDSPGGYAGTTFQLARLFQRRCGRYVAIVPRYAKSAATLFALGAAEIILGDYAELGPLDAQSYDPELESYKSALDDVQALERIHARALQNIDEAMWLMLPRTGKKMDTLLPMILEFEAKFMRPLLEDFDSVHYTQMARLLKVAEEYAVRLLAPNYPQAAAEQIASSLVQDYPEHGFVIDRQEARKLAQREVGLKVSSPGEAINDLINEMAIYLPDICAIGRIRDKQQGAN